MSKGPFEERALSILREELDSLALIGLPARLFVGPCTFRLRRPFEGPLEEPLESSCRLGPLKARLHALCLASPAEPSAMQGPPAWPARVWRVE